MIFDTSAGTAGDLAGTIDTKNDITIVAGGSGTTVTGQFVVGVVGLVETAVLLLLFLSVPVKASPISGAFTTGDMNSTTTTTQTIVESVVSKDYNTGYTYSVSGTGVQIRMAVIWYQVLFRQMELQTELVIHGLV